MSTLTLSFNPPPDAIPEIAQDIFSPDHSLSEVAEIHHTSVEALTLWLARPDIASRLAAIHTTDVLRIRFAATSALRGVVILLDNILHDFEYDRGHTLINPQDPAQADSQQRRRETARRAAALLLRLSRLLPASFSAPSEPPPGGRGLGVGAPPSHQELPPRDPPSQPLQLTTPAIGNANPGISPIASMPANSRPLSENARTPVPGSSHTNGHAESVPPTRRGDSAPSRSTSPSTLRASNGAVSTIASPLAPQPSATAHSPLATGPPLR